MREKLLSSSVSGTWRATRTPPAPWEEAKLRLTAPFKRRTAGVGTPLPAQPGSLGLERRLAVCQGLGKAWLPAFSRHVRRIEINAQLGRIRLTWKSGEFDAARFARAVQSFNEIPVGGLLAMPPEKGIHAIDGTVKKDVRDTNQ